MIARSRIISMMIVCLAMIVCSSSPGRAQLYWFDKTGDVKKLGIAGPGELPIQCPPLFLEYKNLSMSEEVWLYHKTKGFSLHALCILLENGRIRFHPETGERLKTYMTKGVHSSMHLQIERLVRVPTCFAKGHVKGGKGDTESKLFPSGCYFKFDPWTGVAISRTRKRELETFGISVSMGAGESQPVDRPSGALTPTSTTISDFRKLLRR